jgi:hypothetical protein
MTRKQRITVLPPDWKGERKREIEKEKEEEAWEKIWQKESTKDLNWWDEALLVHPDIVPEDPRDDPERGEGDG